MNKVFDYSNYVGRMFISEYDDDCDGYVQAYKIIKYFEGKFEIESLWIAFDSMYGYEEYDDIFDWDKGNRIYSVCAFIDYINHNSTHTYNLCSEENYQKIRNIILYKIDE